MPAVRGIHDVEQNLNLLRAFGIEPDMTDAAPTFNVNEHDRRRAGKMLAAAGIDEDDAYIVIHAGQGAQTILGRAKRWPA